MMNNIGFYTYMDLPINGGDDLADSSSDFHNQGESLASLGEFFQDQGFDQGTFGVMADTINPQQLQAQKNTNICPSQQYLSSTPSVQSDAGETDSSFDQVNDPSMSTTTRHATRASSGQSDDSLNCPAYAALLYECLKSTAPKFEMQLQDIYKWFAANVSRARNAPDDKAWKNSVRHNLSMNQGFVSGSRTNPTGNHKYMWHLADAALRKGIEPTTRYRRVDSRGQTQGQTQGHRRANPSGSSSTTAKQKSGSKGGKATRNGSRRNPPRDTQARRYPNPPSPSPAPSMVPTNSGSSYALSPEPTPTGFYADMEHGALDFASRNTPPPPPPSGPAFLPAQWHGTYVPQPGAHQLLAYPPQSQSQGPAYDTANFGYQSNAFAAPFPDAASSHPHRGYQEPAYPPGFGDTQGYVQAGTPFFDGSNIDPALLASCDPAFPYQNAQFRR